MWKRIVVLALACYIGYQLVDRTDPGEVNNKRVIVTGASKGIGEQLALNYARLGAHVVAIARSEDKLKKVIAECKRVGPEGRIYDYLVADLGDLENSGKVIKICRVEGIPVEENNRDSLAKAATTKLGGLDYLVLNHVGISEKGEWLASAKQYDTLHKSFDLNFFSYVYLASHALPTLEKSSGSIIVVGSAVGKIAFPTVAMYAAEKFALDGFFSAWRQELVMRNISVSITYCVLGLIDTEFGREAMAKTRAQVEGSVKYADASETANAIILGGVGRVREVYTPYHIKFIVMFRDILIVWFEKLVLSDMQDVI